MKVAIAAAGRFHAIRLAQQMEKKGVLERFFSASVTSRDYQDLSPHRVTPVRVCQMTDFLYSQLRLSKIIPASLVNRFKDNLFDDFIRRSVQFMSEVDIFVAWAHYCRWSMPQIKKKSRYVIVESGSSHILEQEKLLQEEYDRAGLAAPPISLENKEKMCAEYELADYIMTPSDFVYDGFVRRGISPKKLLKVRCGADIDFFYDEHEKRPDTIFRVIFVGLVSLRKGIRVLLEAWTKIKDQLSFSAELIIVGAIQHDIKKLVAQYQKDSSIIFRGPVSPEHLKALYRTATVFVLPSVEDGFGMVMGEAMATGLPVICTKNTGGPDIIQEGVEGKLIPAADVHALSDVLLWSFINRQELVTMGERARLKSSSFSWDMYGDAVYREYSKLVGK